MHAYDGNINAQTFFFPPDRPLTIPPFSYHRHRRSRRFVRLYCVWWYSMVILLMKRVDRPTAPESVVRDDRRHNAPLSYQLRHMYLFARCVALATNHCCGDPSNPTHPLATHHADNSFIQTRHRPPSNRYIYIYKYYYLDFLFELDDVINYCDNNIPIIIAHRFKPYYPSSRIDALHLNLCLQYHYVNCRN